MSSLRVAVTVFSFLASASFVHADWSRFRGNNGSGAIAACSVPLPWQPSDVAWEIELPGAGNGSPIVHGDKIFIMSADPKSADRYVMAFDLATGKQLWRHNFPSQPHQLHARSSYASCTPVANDQAVYFAWAHPDSFSVHAYTHTGEPLWNKDLGRYISFHGFGASPILVDDLLVIANDQDAEELPPGVAPGPSSVVAMKASSGDVVWETPRTPRRTCYGTPSVVSDANGRKQLLFTETGDGFFALDAATGKPLWNREVFTKRCVSCPIVTNGLVIGTEGSGGGGNVLYGVDLRGDHKVVFEVRRAAPYVPTPVAKDDLLFLWADNGIVSCVEVPSGKIVWSQRLGGNVSSSPVIAGDKLIGIAEDGTLTILSASRDFKELGSIKLPELTRSTPLLSENYLLIRTDSRLICVGKPQA